MVMMMKSGEQKEHGNKKGLVGKLCLGLHLFGVYFSLLDDLFSGSLFKYHENWYFNKDIICNGLQGQPNAIILHLFSASDQQLAKCGHFLLSQWGPTQSRRVLSSASYNRLLNWKWQNMFHGVPIENPSEIHTLNGLLWYFAPEQA